METDHISIRTSYQGIADYQQMVNNPDERIRVHGTQYLIENLSKTDSLLIVDDVYSTGHNVDAVLERIARSLKTQYARQRKNRESVAQARQLETGRRPDFFLHGNRRLACTAL